MVLGYVVMRVPMLLQWWRASRQEPGAAPATAYAMIASIVVSQAIWCWLALADLPDRARSSLVASSRC